MKKSILIVDDDSSICKLTARLLANDYSTVVASNGREALRILSEKKKFDLVLMDMVMPELDGMELLNTLRSNNKDIAVIMMSGYFTIDSALEASSQGAYAYITKPFDPDELKLSIENALRDS